MKLNQTSPPIDCCLYIFAYSWEKIPVIGRAVPGTYRSLCFSAEVNVILSTIYFGEAGDDIPTIVGIQIDGEFIFLGVLVVMMITPFAPAAP